MLYNVLIECERPQEIRAYSEGPREAGEALAPATSDQHHVRILRYELSGGLNWGRSERPTKTGRLLTSQLDIGRAVCACLEVCRDSEQLQQLLVVLSLVCPRRSRVQSAFHRSCSGCEPREAILPLACSNVKLLISPGLAGKDVLNSSFSLGHADKRLYPVMCCYLHTLLSATHRASVNLAHGHAHLGMSRRDIYAAAVQTWHICRIMDLLASRLAEKS